MSRVLSDRSRSHDAGCKCEEGEHYVPIHKGTRLRVDCAGCGRFLRFEHWPPSSPLTSLPPGVCAWDQQAVAQWQKHWQRD